MAVRVAFFQLYPGDLWFRVQMELLELPLKMVAFYVAVFVLIKQLLARRNYAALAVAVPVYVLAVTFLNRLEDFYLLPVQPITAHPSALAAHTFWDVKAAFLNLIYVYPVVGLGISLYLVKDWLATQVKTERLAREKAEAELQNLKKQLQPHFLFNTLNNLYALTLSQSEQAPETVLRLSEVLSYMTYDCEQDLVPLQKEWEMVQHYVALEKLRLGEKVTISIYGVGMEPQQKVAPLLLLPLVENAFKHGNRLGKAWVRLNAQVQQNRLTFTVENDLPAYTIEEKIFASGVGLTNLRKRLELLYPRSFVLKTQKTDTYLATLQLPLA